MTTNQAHEAAQMVDEIEDDALQSDQPLTVDQRIAVASIRATLASVQGVVQQTAALERNGEMFRSLLAAQEAATVEPEGTTPPEGSGS